MIPTDGNLPLKCIVLWLSALTFLKPDNEPKGVKYILAHPDTLTLASLEIHSGVFAWARKGMRSLNHLPNDRLPRSFGRPYGEDITLRFSIGSSVRPSPLRLSGHHNVLCSTGPTIHTNTLKIAFSKLDTEVEANFQDTPRSASNRTYGVL